MSVSPDQRSQVDPAVLADAVSGAVAAHHGEPGPLIEILHSLQANLGWIPPAAIPQLANELNLSRAEVHGVVTFYHDFRDAPAGHDAGADLPRRGVPVASVPASSPTTRGSGSASTSARRPPTARSRSTRCSASATARSARRSRSTACSTAASTPTGSTPARRRDVMSTPITVYVPRDSAARSVGADEVADRIALAAAEQGRDVTRRPQRLARPALARAAGRGRHRPRPRRLRPGRRPTTSTASSTPACSTAADNGLSHGLTDEMRVAARPAPDHVRPGRRDRPALARRLPAARRPRRPAPRARHHAGAGRRGGHRRPGCAAAAAQASPPASSGTPSTTADGDLKFICCNADEGDSGTFADRMLMEGDPFTLIEGMLIAAHAVGASEGYIYLRSEYPAAAETLRTAIEIAYAAVCSASSVLGSDLAFDLDVRVGAGAYICGEETSMLESLEGKRGVIRAKPPIPALVGSVRQADRRQQRAHPRAGARRSSPTAARRTPSSASAARAAPRSSSSPATSRAAASSRRRSASRSASSSTATAAARARAARCAPCRSAARSAPTCRPSSSTCRWTTRRSPRPARWSATAASWSSTTPSTWRVQARFAMEFCAEESCGKCTPCRIGSVRGVEVIDRIIADRDRDDEPGPARRPVRADDRRLAVRDGRPDADAGAQRPPALPRGLRQARRRPPPRRGEWSTGATGTPTTTGARITEVTTMTLLEGARPRHARASDRARPPSSSRSTARPVTVPAGTSVMRAAALAGVDVPKLCATDSLEAFGSCRLCLVEVDGGKGTPASCTTPCAEGMKVRTQTRQARRSSAAA